MPDPTTAQILQDAADAITHAGYGQRDAQPHHDDFYSIALATEHVLDALYAMNQSIGVQVAGYQTGRRLRTDTNRTPAEVLAAALTHSQDLQAALDRARLAARSLAGEAARLAIAPVPTP